MAVDRTAAVAGAEAAIGDADWEWLTDWVCRVLREDYLRRQREGAAQDAEGRVAGTSATRPGSAQEEQRADVTRPTRRIPD